MTRIVLLLWTVGFLVGTTTHAITVFTVGWMAKEHAPLWMNVYWTSLALLDPLTVILLWTRRRFGVWLGIAVMATDVAINSYAAYGLGFGGFAVFLQLQSLFGGFVLGSAVLLLRTTQAGPGGAK